MATTAHHRVVIVGGGSAGISVAARLRRKLDDVAVIEPSDTHYYQPLWTLVGGGCSTPDKTVRTEASVMPRGVTWIRDAAAAFDPENNAVHTDGGRTITYDVLVVCPGIQLDWGRIPGVSETLGSNGVSSNYTYDLAPKTWDFIRDLRSGSAVFTMPSGPIKCAGAPQKIAYLACDYWREQGVLDKIDVHLVLPTPRTFGVPVFADALDEVVAGYGIQLHLKAELDSVDPDGRKATFTSMDDDGDGFSLAYDVMHVVPHQSAPDWVKASPSPPTPRPATSTSTSTRTSTSATPMCSPSVTPGRPPTPRLVRRSASKRRSFPRTSSPSSQARTRRSATGATRPAHSRRLATRCCWPSSTTPWSRPRRSRSSTRPSPDGTCGSSRSTGSQPCTGT